MTQIDAIDHIWLFRQVPAPENVLNTYVLMNFAISFQEKGSSARCGILKTHHSEIQTPVFMPIGTQGVIKTIDPEKITFVY